MREDLLFADPQVAAWPTQAKPLLVLLTLLVTAATAAGLCAAAILVPAPAMAVPLVVVICVGAPIFAGWEAPGALARLRTQRAREETLAAFRHRLGQLPETEHPLGF